MAEPSAGNSQMKSLIQTDVGIFNTAVCKELGELKTKGPVSGQGIIKYYCCSEIKVGLKKDTLRISFCLILNDMVF